MEEESATFSSDVGTGFDSKIKGILMILFIGISFLVFNVGGYNNFIPGNMVLLTRSTIVGILIISTLILYRLKGMDNEFWRISFSFLISSIGLLLAWFFGKWYQLIPGISVDTVEGLAIA